MTETKISKAQQKSVNKYISNNYDRINLTLPKGYKSEIQTAAGATGESVNGYIKKAIDMRLYDGAECSADPCTQETTEDTATQSQNITLEEAIDRVDLKRLPTDLLYQFEVRDMVGPDMLSELMKKARSLDQPE